ncbi:hypothetical protein [Serratia sp. D1N4]
MFEFASERASELMKIVDYSWKNDKLSKNEFNYLVNKLKENDTNTVESHLLRRGLDKKIIEDLPPIEKKHKSQYSADLFPRNEPDNYAYLEQQIDSWRSLSQELDDKNSILNNELKRSIKAHKDIVYKYDSAIDKLKELEENQEKTSDRIKILTTENTELKNKFQQKRIDEKIPDYVIDVSQKLDDADIFFTRMSNYWSIGGILLAISAVISAFCTFIYGLEAISDLTKLTPTSIAYTFIRGGLGIALLSWISYICFSNSRNYTHESILRKDRQHALTFGRLFLQIYGSTATKEDAINVFKDWNMSGDTAFSNKSKMPPNPLKYLDSFRNALFKQNNVNKDSSKATE